MPCFPGIKGSAEPGFSWTHPEGIFFPFFPDWLRLLGANVRKTGTNRSRCKTRSGIPSLGSSLLPTRLQAPRSIPNPGIYSLLITVEMFKCFSGWDSGGMWSSCGAFGNLQEGFLSLDEEQEQRGWGRSREDLKGVLEKESPWNEEIQGRNI